MKLIISVFFRVICTACLYRKLIIKNEYKISSTIIFHLTYSLLFISSIIMQLIYPHLSSFIYPFALCVCMILIYRTKFDLALITSIISYVIFQIIATICSMLLAITCIPFYYCHIQPALILLDILNGSFSYIVVLFFTKIKRFKSIHTTLTNAKFIKNSIVIILTIVTFKSIDTYQILKENYTSYKLYGNFLPLATFLLAILLFAWWRRMITKSYIEKIRKLERQSLYDELAENAATIRKLREDNQALARILHKDNKLIPAMENAVTEFLLCRTSAELSEAKIYGEKLVAELQFMFQDRKGIMDDYDSQNVCLTQTGTVAIDAMLAYMQKRAASGQVSFTCKHTPAAMEHLLTRISPEDLSHLLSDLLENALNAMSDTNGGKLQVVLGKLEKDAYISVADTGTSFDIETLQLLGIQQHTTHADTGGSGIGLMDIWKLKKKYRASIQIQEFESQQNAYTKKITLFFNNKNHYVIQSYRHKEIINTQTRGDLYVIPAETIQVTEEFTHE